MEVVSLPQSGGCVCGAIRYSLLDAPLLAYACHCHDCQKATGTAFTLTLVIRTADLQVTGAPEIAASSFRSGRVVERSFCPKCRVPLFSLAPVAPGYMSLRAGTLDDASWVVPISQSFVESAIPWAVIPGVRIVPWSEFDYAALGAEWVASAPEFRWADRDGRRPRALARALRSPDESEIERRENQNNADVYGQSFPEQTSEEH
jgi:hypothetical protein